MSTGVKQPNPAKLNIPAIIDAHGMAGTVAHVPSAAEPLDTFKSYAQYRAWLLKCGRRAVGVAGMTRYSPLVTFLQDEHSFADVRVYPAQIEIEGTRYQTPAWVRRLILAEKLYGEGRLMSGQVALRTLDIVLDGMECEEEARDGNAVAG